MQHEEKVQKIDEIIHILRAERSWLFQRYGFNIVYSNLGGRYKSEPAVGLSNEKIQLLLFNTYDHPMLACPGTQFVNPVDEISEEVRILNTYWQSSIMIFNFLDGLPQRYGRDKPSAFLNHLTWQKLETRMLQLEEMFASEEAMRRWMPDFVRYLGGPDGYIPKAKRTWLEASDIP